MLVIGLDAASQLSNFGYAIGRVESGKVIVHEAGILGSPVHVGIAAIVAAVQRESSVLLAIDAPLGWPIPLGIMLGAHRAGEPANAEKDSLFRRETDLVVRRLTKKVPLEIGADKIARAAHSALDVLAQIRLRSGMPLPMLWAPTFEGGGVVEVYPAATLKSNGLPFTGYKKDDERPVRVAIALQLRDVMPDLQKFVDAKADVFDACLCLLAARDFLAGHCQAPTSTQLLKAEIEGWIWVRPST